jgi:hypothetical protein
MLWDEVGQLGNSASYIRSENKRHVAALPPRVHRALAEIRPKDLETRSPASSIPSTHTTGHTGQATSSVLAGNFSRSWLSC